MNHFPFARAGIAVRDITEDAEAPEVAENGDNAPREVTSVLRVKASREAGNASARETHP